MPPKRTKSALSSNKNGSQWENTLTTAVFCEKVNFISDILKYGIALVQQVVGLISKLATTYFIII